MWTVSAKTALPSTSTWLVSPPSSSSSSSSSSTVPLPVRVIFLSARSRRGTRAASRPTTSRTHRRRAAHATASGSSCSGCKSDRRDSSGWRSTAAGGRCRQGRHRPDGFVALLHAHLNCRRRPAGYARQWATCAAPAAAAGGRACRTNLAMRQFVIRPAVRGLRRSYIGATAQALRSVRGEDGPSARTASLTVRAGSAKATDPARALTRGSLLSRSGRARRIRARGR